MDSGFAPAKVNLSLHVTGRRQDGYHLLDSLVVFAGVGDVLTARPAAELSLRVSGPFAQGVPTDSGNLVLRAAETLRARRGVKTGAALALVKNLPHAAGLGSGSSDAAAAIRRLADLWKVDPLHPDDPDVAALGADVPVCLQAPSPVRMGGIGEVLEPVPQLPPFAVVLVNPRVDVATPAVFRALETPHNPPMPDLQPGLTQAAFFDWLAAQRNDLGPPAQSIAPEITRALDLLRRTPGIALAVMSGSGATCVGIARDLAAAKSAARSIQVSEMGWWVVPAPVLA